MKTRKKNNESSYVMRELESFQEGWDVDKRMIFEELALLRTKLYYYGARIKNLESLRHMEKFIER